MSAENSFDASRPSEGKVPLFENPFEAPGNNEEHFLSPGENQYEAALQLGREHQAKPLRGARTVREWLDFARQHNTTIAPFNTSASIADDRQFRVRMGFLSAEAVGCEQVALPIFVNGQPLYPPTKTPTVEEHNRSILTEAMSSLAPHRSSKDER